MKLPLDLPVVHVQEESTSFWIQLVPQKFLKFGDQHFSVRCSHRTELNKKAAVDVVIHIHCSLFFDTKSTLFFAATIVAKPMF